MFLYPDDSDEEGRLLRVYQQYFMVSCGAQLILQRRRSGEVICMICQSMWQSRSMIRIRLW